jgi:serine/threonine-protein kinase PknK
VERPLGEGAIGTWLARDLLHDRDVALKAIPASHALVDSVRTELAVLSRVAHPGIVPLLDIGRIEGGLFYTSPLIDARRLDELEGGAPAARAAAIAILEALACLHAHGIRHGDLKPDNVLIDPARGPLLIDFGCAGPLRVERAPTVSGTPGFLAPEVLRGGPIDCRADLHALGVTLEQAGLARRDPALAALATRMRSSQVDRRPRDCLECIEALGGRSVRRVPFAQAPILERDGALEAIDAAIEALAQGAEGPRVITIAGAAGSGRSRLLREVRWRAQRVVETIEAPAISGDGLTRALRSISRSERTGPDLAIAALEALALEGARLVIALDDVERLPAAERDLTEALARAIDPGAPLALIVASTAPITASIAIDLPPLSLAAVRAWSRLAEADVSALLARTGGSPRAIARTLAALDRGEIDEHRLRDPAPLAIDLGTAVDLASVLEPAALALVAAAGGAIDLERAQRSESWRAIERVVASGQLRREGETIRLERIDEAPALLRALPPAIVRAAHARLSESAGDPPSRALHLALSGAADAAREQIAAALAGAGRARPGAWAHAARALVAVDRRPEHALLAAELEELAGRPRHAVALALALLRTRPAAEIESRARTRAAAGWLRIGKIERALRHLARARTAGGEDARAAIDDLESRARLKQGSYDLALSIVESALARGAHEPGLRGALLEDVGAAASYLGHAARARDALAEAAALYAESGDARASSRTSSYRGLLEYRVGALDAARDAYRASMELAEREGLSDLVAHAALNLGVVAHRLGEWGEALSSYERALRLSHALGKVGSALTADFDRARLWADVGLLDRAEVALAHVERAARSEGHALLACSALAVRGEVIGLRGDSARAVELLGAALETLEREGALREIAEVRVLLAEVELARGDLAVGAAHAREAHAIADRLGAADLRARASELDARVAIAEGDGARARALLERAVADARSSQQRVIEAEVEGHLALAAEHDDMRAVARVHRERARGALERIAATLPATLRGSFFRHPRRAFLAEEPERAGAQDPSRDRRFLRLLAIYRKLGLATRARDVLETAMDAAIELTGAERGFLLLASSPGSASAELEVAVARNLDRERIGRSHLKFSRGIAERALASETPIVTTDAEGDPRFHGQSSVHAMRLKSVAAVPIVGAEGVLGALYLDNRFERGRFDGEDVELLVLFADQVAIALANARLRDALEQRTAELEAERQRVLELLDRREQQIERLEDEVRSKQQALEHRYDYTSILGRSDAMRRVLAMLDRVIESEVPILVMGESGTGKELIARAIHYQGPRKDGPFVAVNCGALPATLLESELFGHVRGAFTGADRDRKGLFLEASGGTLFLDEIGEMPLELQPKLLRVLQEREVRPVGASRAIRVDVRLVSATNRTIREEVDAKRFRRDLYYRIGVVEVALPALRERREDIPELARHFVERLAERYGRGAPAITARAMRALIAASWPGNVRQLENVITRAFLSTDGAIDVAALADLGTASRAAERPRDRAAWGKDRDARIRRALEEHDWNVSEVARALAIPRPTLYRHLRRLALIRKPE